ncbi:MAG: aldehyde reductase [Deltaproteobacteria bacterium]|nr:aldehyde reductase [Deltaproteobacteria bacterium]
MSSETVLVTGISGYIALYCAGDLLRAGYKVRGSVRSKAKEKEVRATMEAASIDSTHLEFVELDLNSDSGWAEATKDCTYVMHVASPFVMKNPKSESDMIQPAVDGTLRALRASKAAGVKRFVLTSSTVAMMGTQKSGTFGPESWTPTDSSQTSTYAKSKTLAEKAAWDFIKQQSDHSPMELVSVNPGGVFGPPLGRNISGQSMEMMSKWLAGEMPMVPNIAFPMIDVRDVSEIHLKSMTHPKAAGLRILAASEEAISFSRIAKILNDNGFDGPSQRIAPSIMLRIVALFDREAKAMRGWLDMNIKGNNSKTRELFNWTPRPFEESLVETANAVQALRS